MKQKQYLVVGAGRFGTAVSMTLAERGHEVVVLDRSEAAIEAIMSRVTHALIGDAADEETLKRLGIRNFDAVVVAIGENLEANILCTTLLKGLGAQHVVSKAASLLAARVLERVGADEVIRPEHDMGVQLADHLTAPGILDTFDFGSRHGVLEIEARGKFTGRLVDLKLPGRFGVHVIAVARGAEMELTPGPDFTIRQGDSVVLIGSNEAIRDLKEHLD